MEGWGWREWVCQEGGVYVGIMSPGHTLKQKQVSLEALLREPPPPLEAQVRLDEGAA